MSVGNLLNCTHAGSDFRQNNYGPWEVGETHDWWADDETTSEREDCWLTYDLARGSPRQPRWRDEWDWKVKEKKPTVFDKAVTFIVQRISGVFCFFLSLLLVCFTFHNLKFSYKWKKWSVWVKVWSPSVLSVVTRLSVHKVFKHFKINGV